MYFLPIEPCSTAAFPFLRANALSMSAGMPLLELVLQGLRWPGISYR